MRRLFTLTGRLLWNGGSSLLGLLASLGGTPRVNRRDGVLEVVGGWLVRLLGRLELADALTLGDVILYADAALVPVLRTHEMVHVRQYRRWGPLFLPAYGLESLYQWIRTGDGYHHNRFEVAAYRGVDSL